VSNTSNGSTMSAIQSGGSSAGPSQNETTVQEWTVPEANQTITVS
jgi:hypothetical protein